MYTSYAETVLFLESLSIMPKSMPGLEKIKKALQQTSWFSKIDPKKVIVVAGTNGKGSTCAALESLLVQAGQRTGFYSSPHLVSTTERIRLNKLSISEADFVKLFNQCEALIREAELSHFEALTLMAGHYFFDDSWKNNLDFVIFEVGLGGTFDATNAFPHKYNIITKLGLDHTNILGTDLLQVAENKFGIVGKKSIVIHHRLAPELEDLKRRVQKQNNSNWIESETAELEINKKMYPPGYFLNYMDLKFAVNLMGARAAENIMTAISMFQILGFDLAQNVSALNTINWPGRMQKLNYSGMQAPLFISGDHNVQGVESLIELLNDFTWSRLHLVVGIGADKDANEMLMRFADLKNADLYLTETPFKGKKLNEYPEIFRFKAKLLHENVADLLTEISKRAQPDDLVLVSGSLYLVGEVIKLTEHKAYGFRT